MREMRWYLKKLIIEGGIASTLGLQAVQPIYAQSTLSFPHNILPRKYNMNQDATTGNTILID